MFGLNYMRAIIAAAIITLLMGTHWKAYTAGEKHIIEKNRIALARGIEIANAGTIQLQADSEKLQGDKIAKLQKLNADANRIIISLRARPSRNTDSPSTAACPKTSCTGASLYSEDGVFLIREAARADELITELEFCQTQYNKVRDTFNRPSE